MILKPVENIQVFSKAAEAHLGVFASEKWLSVYGDQLQLVGIYKDEHQLIGGFCYLKIKKFGFKFIKLPPYTPHCCLFFTGEGKNNASKTTFSKEVLTEVCAYIANQKAALNILALPSSIVDLQPFIWQKFKVIPNYTYRINLNRPFEDIQTHFDSKNRNAINKAQREDLQVQFNTLDKEQLYLFFKRTLSVAGANVYDGELKRIFTSFSDAGNSFSTEAWKDGKLLGCVFCIYDKTTCYYLLAGIDRNSGVGGVNNLLVARSIELAKQKKCEVFDFEGSMLKGVEKFFRSFGGELIPYYTINKASLPIEMLLKFRKREIF